MSMKLLHLRLGMLLLVGLLVLSACGKEDKKGIEGASNELDSTLPNNAVSATTGENTDSEASSEVNNIATNAQFAGITPAENSLGFPPVPALVGKGSLLFTQGFTRTVSRNEGDGAQLYLASFEGGAPQLLASRVFVPTLALSPNGKLAAYVAVDGRRWYSYILNLETLESVQLIQLGSQFGFVQGWSANNDWYVLTGFGVGTFLISIDGQNQIELGTSFGAFTTDNKLVVINFTNVNNNQGPPTIATTELLDLATLERSPIDVTFEDEAGVLGIYSTLRQAGYDLQTEVDAQGQFAQGPLYVAENDTLVSVNGTNAANGNFNTPAACSTFNIASEAAIDGTQNDVYEAPDTVLITDFKYRAGDFYFQRWYFGDCVFAQDNLYSDLMRISGDEMEIVASELFPGDDLNIGFLRSQNGSKYGLSPDNSYVAWLGGSTVNRQSEITITDIQTDETVTLARWNSSTNDAFVNREAITAILWTSVNH